MGQHRYRFQARNIAPASARAQINPAARISMPPHRRLHPFPRKHIVVRGLSKPSLFGARLRKAGSQFGLPPQFLRIIRFSHSRCLPSQGGLIEVPLVLYRVGTRSANRTDLNNQIATYLNIDADCGFAPPAWQSHVGTIVIARKDRKPLLPQHLEGVWMFCDHILDLFGEGEGAPRWLYNRRAFEEWWVRYCEEQKEFRPGKGGEEDPDYWQAVRSPYEI